MMMDLNLKRLKFARKRRGFSIRQLSDKLGITSKTYSDFENGRRYPTKSMLFAIAKELHFSENFFFLDDISTLNDKSVSFRSLARMPAYVKNAAINAGRIALELYKWLDERFEIPNVDLPDLRNYEPEAAAITLRKIWGFGEQPIHNLIHLLEAKGVFVFSLSENTYDMDAYSFWMGDRPFVFLNTKKSSERSRFDAAHELGHLVLHKHGTPRGKEVEGQANHFASAFLMPSGSIVSRVPRYITLDWIIKAKSFWIVAASALLRRLKDLSLLTEWRYRSLTIELSGRGFTKKEPNPTIQREASKLLFKIFHALREDGITKEDIAKELGIFVDEIDSLIFNLTIFGINGGIKGSSSSKSKGENSNHLKRIK